MGRVVIAGLSGVATGLGHVLESLTRVLREAHEIEIVEFAIGAQRGVQCRLDGTVIVHQIGIDSRHFVAPAEWLASLFARFAPERVLVSGPGFMALPFLRQLAPFRGAAPVSLYLPVEGTLVGETLRSVLGSVDNCLLYSDDALRGAAALCDRLAASDSAFVPPALVRVGHGFAQKAFFPLAAATSDFDQDRRRGARRALWADRADLDDAFIVLNANRVAPRKQLGLTLEGFASFARGRKDVWLCLHTGRRLPSQAEMLEAECDRLGIRAQVILSPARPDEPLTPSSLNLLYNACDVGLTTSSGEGWGLGVFEHASTRAAQIVPDHGALAENWCGSAVMVPTVDQQFVFYESTINHLVDPTDVAEAISRLYEDPVARSALADAALRNASQYHHSWEAVAAAINEFTGSGEVRSARNLDRSFM